MIFLRKLPPHAGDEIADVIVSRQKSSTLVTSNREIDDWTKLLGDVVIVTPLLDRLMHHGHLLKFIGKSWRLQGVRRAPCQRPSNRVIIHRPVTAR